MPRVTKKIRVYNARILQVDVSVHPNVATRVNVSDMFHYISTLPFDRTAVNNVYLEDEHGKVLSIAVDDDGSISGHVKGRFASTRTDLLPQIEHNGMISDPTIPIGAGYYDPIHFVYFVQENRLAMEVNGNGPYYGKFGRYLEEKTRNHPTVEVDDGQLYPLISADVYNRLVVDGTIAEIELEVYRGYGAIVQNTQNGLGDVLSALDNLPEGPTTFTVGFKGEKTTTGRTSIGEELQQDVVSLLRQFRTSVTKAVARVRRPNPVTRRTRTDPIDLLEAKAIFYARPVEVRARVLDSQSMYAEIITGYQNFATDEVR